MTKLIGGRAQLGGQTYRDTHTGTIVVGTGAVAISAVTVACFEVLVQADPDNTGSVLIGNNTQGCTVQLTADSAITVRINDVEKIMARAVSGTQRVNWLAMT